MIDCINSARKLQCCVVAVFWHAVARLNPVEEDNDRMVLKSSCSTKEQIDARIIYFLLTCCLASYFKGIEVLPETIDVQKLQKIFIVSD